MNGGPAFNCLVCGNSVSSNQKHICAGPPYTSTLGSNPKDNVGSKKISITKLPMVALIHGAHAMMDGARKYGPYNWRDNAVVASIYVDAMIRHAGAWFEGEETATDSGVHHLGHAIANAAILLDALETGNLKDDRPRNGKFIEVLARLNKSIGEVK